MWEPVESVVYMKTLIGHGVIWGRSESDLAYFDWMDQGGVLGNSRQGGSARAPGRAQRLARGHRAPETWGAMAGVACLGKAADADEWCDSGLGSLGPDAAAPGGPGLGAELGPGLSWAPLVFGYVTEDGDT